MTDQHIRRSDDGKWRWQPVGAAKHTYDPIREVRTWPRSGLFGPRVDPEPGTALVVHRRGRPLEVLWPPTLSNARRAWGGHSTSMTRRARVAAWFDLIRHVYLVDISDHQLEIRTDLPCRSDGFHFRASLDFTCAVADPAIVVQHWLTDLGSTLEPVLVGPMRNKSREYGVDESATAERAITLELRKTGSTRFHPGVRLKNLVVRLELDDATSEWVRNSERRPAAGWRSP